MRPVLILLFGTLLSACGGSGGGDPVSIDGSGGNGGPIRAADLCVNNGCGEAVQLIAIPDAENLLFAPDGRLFVSGGQNVYEITKTADGSFTATPLSAQTCSFTGLAIRGDILYAVGCDNQLLAGALTARPALEPIFAFEGTCIANGMALGPDDRLYVVDEPLVSMQIQNCLPGDPKIVRLTLDPSDPLRVTQQETWVQGSPNGLLFLGLDNILRVPNGLVRDGNIFYATDGGSVFSVELQPDGRAGPVTPLFFEPTAHDDLGLGGIDGLLVTDFFKGRILLLSRDGRLLQETDAFTFTAASAVRLGQPPMFQPTDILVTDKGVIGDNNLPIDFLTLFRRRAPVGP